MKYVLFVCAHNAGRSQIAQAFFERYAPADIRAESAGEEPAAAIWPNVVEAMREIGIDISHRRPKKLDLETQLHADWAITLHCKASCRSFRHRSRTGTSTILPDSRLRACARSATRSSSASATSSSRRRPH